MGPKVLPPSVERYIAVLQMYTVSGLAGSTVTPPKYQPRFQMRLSLLISAHVVPASSDRYNPPSTSSTSAKTRSAFDGDTAIPIRPGRFGSPCPVSLIHDWPPSIDL